MAQERKAALAWARNIGSDTRLLQFTTEYDELAFAGGQYVIVHAGMPEGGGKATKRAYSILTSDRERRSFQIAVRKIAQGGGSNFMHALPEGATLSFSGPWGKYRIDGSPGQRALILATDTGITAALGLVQSQDFGTWSRESSIVWLVESDQYFLPEAFVRERAAGCCSLEVIHLPPAGTPERTAWFENWSPQFIQGKQPDAAFLSGDGLLLFSFRDLLLARGMSADQIRLETFFNHKKAAEMVASS